MKRRSYGLLLFVLAALVDCTILSCFIEEQMAIPVRTVRGHNSKGDVGICALPHSAIQEDGDGFFVLSAKEQNGIRKSVVAERNNIVLMGDGEQMAFTNADMDQDYIRYAAREVEDGVQLRPVKEAASSPDTYLFFPADGGSVQLIEMQESPTPFMVGQARENLEKQGMYAERICSLTEVAALYTCCPKLALAGVLSLTPFFLLIPTCIGFRLLRDCRKFLLVNGMLCVGAWCAMTMMLHSVQLPASLLPTANILDFFHYQALMEDIHTALGGFDIEIVELSQREAYGGLPVVVLLLSVLVSVGAGETLIIKKSMVVGKHGRKAPQNGYRHKNTP